MPGRTYIAIDLKSFFCTLFLSMVSVFCMGQTEPEFEIEPFAFNRSSSSIGVVAADPMCFR